MQTQPQIFAIVLTIATMLANMAGAQVRKVYRADDPSESFSVFYKAIYAEPRKNADPIGKIDCYTPIHEVLETKRGSKEYFWEKIRVGREGLSYCPRDFADEVWVRSPHNKKVPVDTVRLEYPEGLRRVFGIYSDSTSGSEWDIVRIGPLKIEYFRWAEGRLQSLIAYGIVGFEEIHERSCMVKFVILPGGRGFVEYPSFGVLSRPLVIAEDGSWFAFDGYRFFTHVAPEQPPAGWDAGLALPKSLHGQKAGKGLLFGKSVEMEAQQDAILVRFADGTTGRFTWSAVDDRDPRFVILAQGRDYLGLWGKFEFREADRPPLTFPGIIRLFWEHGDSVQVNNALEVYAGPLDEKWSPLWHTHGLKGILR